MATKKEREALLLEQKEILMSPFETLEELKASSKVLTKIIDLFSTKVKKLSAEFYDAAWSAKREIPYEEQSVLKAAVWSFVSVHPYAKSMINIPDALALIEKRFPLLHEKGKIFNEQIKDDTQFILEAEAHIQNEKERLKGTKAQQFVSLASKSRDLSAEKQQAFMRYCRSLENWKPAELVRNEVFVNGHVYRPDCYVGVMIGRGDRVHKMQLEVLEFEDKETKKTKRGIYIKNYTQWRNSSLVVLDLIENIPSELFSEQN